MTSVNKLRQVSSVQFCDTSFVCCFVCLPPRVRSPLITTCLTSSYPLLPHPTLFSLCVYAFVFVCLVCSLTAFSFTSHIRVKSCGPWLFLSDLFCSAFYSQDPSMLLQMAELIFLWPSSIPLYVGTTSLSKQLRRDALAVSCLHVLAAVNNAAMNTGVPISLRINAFNFFG